MGLWANNPSAITRLGPHPGRRAKNFLLFLQLTAMVSSYHKSDPRLTSAKGAGDYHSRVSNGPDEEAS